MKLGLEEPRQQTVLGRNLPATTTSRRCSELQRAAGRGDKSVFLFILASVVRRTTEARSRKRPGAQTLGNPARRYARRLIRQAHRIIRAVGIVVLFGGVVAAIYLYQSPSHYFRCDALKRIERQQAGKDYWCWWPD
jgi:hypothetical protein